MGFGRRDIGKEWWEEGGLKGLIAGGLELRFLWELFYMDFLGVWVYLELVIGNLSGFGGRFYDVCLVALKFCLL